jgi:hypothetical protein
LFALADGALYAAKVRRNMTVVAEPLGVLRAAGPELQLQAVD